MHDELRQAIQDNLPEAFSLVRYLYDHPETAGKEVLSSRALAEALERSGFQVEYPFMEKELGYGTAFRAVLENGPGPRAAILAEYDALPEMGHGCGHNFYGPLSILAAQALARCRDLFSGTLEVIGTPGEEEEGAKLHMAPAGIFDGMDLAIMMHSGSGPCSYTDMDTTSLRCYIVEFFGQSAHAAGSPWLGHNALTAARKFMDLLDARRDSFQAGTIMSGVILDGGKQPNMVPDYAKIRMEFRSPSMKNLKELDRIVRNCARGAALALDCSEKFTSGFPDFYGMVRVPALEEKVAEKFRELGAAVEAPLLAGGSSDVGNVSYRCPTIQPVISITDRPYSLHTPEFRDATLTPHALQQMAVGAEVIAETVLAIFNDRAFREKVREDFQRVLASKKG
jgi:amidohydrolase